MPIHRTLAPLALLAALPATPALAQIADLPAGAVRSDETIIVTANRTPRSFDQVGQSVTVIGEEEIVTRQPTAVTDLLRTVPGVTFGRNGGPGTVTGVSIRGADSDQSVVLIDGVKLNDPASPGGGFNFGPLLAGNIARVEVVRGAQSVLYGSQAIGGVVNLITREPTREPALFASIEGGSRDTAHLVGNIAGRLGPVGASLGATFLRDDGVSAFSEARGGSETDGFESFGVNAKLDIALLAGVALDLRGFYADGETQVDGFPPPDFALADTSEVSRRQDLVAYAGLKADLMDGRLRNRLGLAVTDIDRRDTDRSGNAPIETFAATGENRRLEYQGVFDATDRAELVFGAEREVSRYESASFGGPAAGADTWINSLYGQLNLTPVAGFSLTAGIRHDDHQTFGGETTVAASGAFSPDGGVTVLRASYGEGFKAPSLFQLFSDFGNRGLFPERSQGWDAGIARSFAGGKARASITRFERTSRDLIVFVPCFGNALPPCQSERPPFGTYDNIARARAQGWELAAALAPAQGIELSAQYSTIEAVDRTSGKRLPRRADETFSLLADVGVPGGPAIGATLLAVGDSFDDAANRRPLSGYVLVDLRASLEVAQGVELFGRIENLFDKRYETVLFYGQPGRAAFGGIRARL